MELAENFEQTDTLGETDVRSLIYKEFNMKTFTQIHSTDFVPVSLNFFQLEN